MYRTNVAGGVPIFDTYIRGAYIWVKALWCLFGSVYQISYF